MGYLYILLMSIMFSFVGVLVKTSGLMVNAYFISFFRFFIGCFFLYIIIKLFKRKIKLHFYWPIFMGAICKSINYFAENYGLSKGYSFGNIIVWPVQCIIALLFSALFLKEKVTFKGIFGSLMCIVGIAIISWNGKSLSGFLESNFLYTLLFSIAGIGAAGFIISQKLLLDKMDSGSMNFSMFLIGSLITAIPLPFAGETTGSFNFLSVIALLLLGFITGGGFLLVAQAMKTIPFFIATIMQSSSVILTLIWAVLFYNEPVTFYVVTGTIVFVLGMIFVNLKLPSGAKNKVKVKG